MSPAEEPLPIVKRPKTAELTAMLPQAPLHISAGDVEEDAGIFRVPVEILGGRGDQPQTGHQIDIRARGLPFLQQLEFLPAVFTAHQFGVSAY